MRSTLDELLALLGDIDDFVASIAVVKKMGGDPSLSVEEQTTLHRSLGIRKRFDHAALIVTLYAALEKYVEDLVWSYARLQTSRNAYGDLPSKLRDKNLHQSGELFRKGLGEGRYRQLTAVQLVSNLHGCLSGAAPYTLTREAVVHHELNLRPDVVQGLFGTVGIANVHARARSAEGFEAWYRENVDQLPEGGIPETVIGARLNDLVERRNEAAHRGGALLDAEGVDDMQDKVRFVEAYCRALFVVVAACSLGDSEAIDVNITSRPQRAGLTVAVVTMPACQLHLGQPIYGTRSGGIDRVGVIKGIRLDEKAVEAVNADSGVDEVGIELDFRIARKTCLHIPVDLDKVVWV